jgi:hypothetical protein
MTNSDELLQSIAAARDLTALEQVWAVIPPLGPWSSLRSMTTRSLAL